VTAYLDWNATSPPHPEVQEAMREALSSAWANPASVHGAGRKARDRVELSREHLAQLLTVESRDVVLTSGGTEANHLALAGAVAIVTSRLEHPSVAREAERLQGLGTPVRFVDVTQSGTVEPDAIDQALAELGRGAVAASAGGALGAGRLPIVVAVAAANHETGVIQPLEAIARSVHTHGAWLHVDAVQVLGRGSPSALAFADSLSVAAHKFRGPKGIGALAFRNGRRLVARGLGGSQERGLRAGTVDAVACAGLHAALARLERSLDGYRSAEQLRSRLERSLRGQARLPLTLHGADAPRLPHVSNFGFEGTRGDELVAALDLLGVHVSSGSACAAGTTEPSAVITAMAGLDAARCAVRVSFGEDSGEAELSALLHALERLGLLSHPSSSA